jgi:hypothetical protein
MQTPIGIDVNIQGLEVRRCVDETDVASLDEVIRDNDVLLVGRDLDVVRPDGGLDCSWVVRRLMLLRSEMSRAAMWLSVVRVK